MDWRSAAEDFKKTVTVSGSSDCRMMEEDVVDNSRREDNLRMKHNTMFSSWTETSQMPRTSRIAIR